MLEKKYLDKVDANYKTFAEPKQRLSLPTLVYTRQQLEAIVFHWYTKGYNPYIIQSEEGKDLEEIIELPEWKNKYIVDFTNIDALEIIRCVNLWYWFFYMVETNKHLEVGISDTLLMDLPKFLLYEEYKYSEYSMN